MHIPTFACSWHTTVVFRKGLNLSTQPHKPGRFRLLSTMLARRASSATHDSMAGYVFCEVLSLFAL